MTQVNLDRLARQHAFEELLERFGLRPEVGPDGDVTLAWTALEHVRLEGRALDPDRAAALARHHGLNSTTEGLALPASAPEDAEEALLGFLGVLLQADPEAFLRREARHPHVPQSGVLPESRAALERLYGGEAWAPTGGFIPRDKKSPVVDLARCEGPLLRSIDREPLVLLDVGSQIATLPGGFRPDPVQAALDDGRFDAALLTAHGADSGEFAAALRAHLPPGFEHVAFTNSGAEAIEKALHTARTHGPGGRRVLCFEGSFHGRTLLALSLTHSPDKRTPYELEGYTVDAFLPYPVVEDPTLDPPVPTGWRESWADPSADREADVRRFRAAGDAQLGHELDALLAAEQSISRGDVMACLLEPFQCEGGDRPITRRFFHGLRALTRGHGVPLIVDEVQTGGGLSGGALFWHKRFWTIGPTAQPDGPDLVVTAKRAQVGVVLSRWPIPATGPAHLASILRGHTHLGLVSPPLTQEDVVSARLDRLGARYPEGLIGRPRAYGDAFAFDLPTKAITEHLVNQRFYRGLMYYTAGERTLRFRLNRAFTARDVDRVFDALERSVDALIAQAGGYGPDLVARLSAQVAPTWGTDPLQGARATFDLGHALRELLLTGSAGIADGILRVTGELWDTDRDAACAWLGLPSDARGPIALRALEGADATRLESELGLSMAQVAADLLGTRIRRIRPADIDVLHPVIDAIEAQAYETARRDPLAYLRIIAKSDGGVMLLAETPDEPIGMAFAGPLELWWGIDGPRQDPNLGRGNTLYSADVTVSQGGRGRGLGHRLRARLLTEALRERRPDGSPRYAFVTGRNRVGAADAMWAINRKLGAYEVTLHYAQYGEPEGVARYYRIPLRRHDRRAFAAPPPPQTTCSFSDGVENPTGPAHPALVRARDLGVLDEPMLTKLTVSNFVTRPFIRWGETVRAIRPRGMEHVYFTSARDEMVDKTLRSLKHRTPRGNVAIGLIGGFFGTVTAAARSISDLGAGATTADGYFDWPRVPHPTDDLEGCLAALDAQVERHGPERLLALFVESVQAKTGTTLTAEAFASLCAWRDRTGVPLVLSETTTGRYRTGAGPWWLDAYAPEGCAPDLVLWWGGGQLGHVFSNETTFVKKPLALISTWDGDELSATRSRLQLHVARQAPVAERAAQLERGLLAAGVRPKDLRGLGLYRVLWGDADVIQRVRLSAVEHGFEVDARFGQDRIVLAPALTVSAAAIDAFVATVSEVLS